MIVIDSHVHPIYFEAICADEAALRFRTRQFGVQKQSTYGLEETLTAPWELSDPCGEDAHSPVPGLVHRYPDRVLFLVTDRCASYCRYCTRSRLVSNASGYDFHPEFDQQIAYIAAHPEIRDVLLSGDPLLLNG